MAPSYTLGCAPQAVTVRFAMPLLANTKTAGSWPAVQSLSPCYRLATDGATRKALGVRKVMLDMRHDRGCELA